MLDALRSLQGVSTRHSYRKVHFHVKISSRKGDLDLDLWRDSDYRKEYWVFYPEYRITELMLIDGIYSSAFDDY